MRLRAVVRLAVALSLASFGVLIGGSTATATVTTGEASAYGLSIALTGVLDEDTGLVPAAGVSSPGPGSDTQSSPDLSGLPLVVSGTATAHAETDVDGLNGVRTALANAQLGDLGVEISVLILDILAINAGEISSAVSVSGDFGALDATGTSTFGDASFTVNNVTFGLDPNYAPNTVVYDTAGIFIIANEQILIGDGTTLEGITVNALRVALADVEGLSGSIVLGQSQAVLTAVPEPGTALLLLCGLAVLARAGRRRS